jgi:hypothetical protein
VRSIPPTRRWLVGAAVAAGLLLAACGSDNGGNSASPQVVSGNGAASAGDGASAGAASSDVSDEELALEFAECVRGEGVDWPDPITLADGSIDLLGGQGPEAITAADGTIDDGTQAALDTCVPIVEGSSLLPGADDIDAETQDQLLEFAQCLRDNGVDVDDPDLSVIGTGRGPAAIFGSNFDPSDPTTEDAIGNCQSLFTGGLGSQGG